MQLATSASSFELQLANLNSVELVVDVQLQDLDLAELLPSGVGEEDEHERQSFCPKRGVPVTIQRIVSS